MTPKYADGKTEARVGDVVRPAGEDGLATLQAFSASRPGYVWLSDRTWPVDFFCLTLIRRSISRKEQPMSPPTPTPTPTPDEPLVKWPDESKKLTWPQLHDNTPFVFDMTGCRQAVHLRVVGGYVSFVKSERSTLSVCNENKSYPVRMVKITKSPTCEVI